MASSESGIPAIRPISGQSGSLAENPENDGTSLVVPLAVARHGDEAIEAWINFFVAHLHNDNTRRAYAFACRDLFTWLADECGIEDIRDVRPRHIASWVRWMSKERGASKPTVKLKLAAIRSLFRWLVTHQVIPRSPASEVNGPKHSVRVGKTPVLSTDEARRFMRWLPARSIVDLRDRALIATMTYAFARVSATVGLNSKSIRVHDSRWMLKLEEKGGKTIDVPCHHNLEAWLRAYVEAADLRDKGDVPIFQTVNGRGMAATLTGERMSSQRAYEMVLRRAWQAYKDGAISTGWLTPHSFRAIGITAYLEDPAARLEVAQHIAGHAKPETTQLYDRRAEKISLDEIERIGI